MHFLLKIQDNVGFPDLPEIAFNLVDLLLDMGPQAPGQSLVAAGDGDFHGLDFDFTRQEGLLKKTRLILTFEGWKSIRAPSGGGKAGNAFCHNFLRRGAGGILKSSLYLATVLRAMKSPSSFNIWAIFSSE